MKVSTGVFTYIEVDVDEWETDKARYFKVRYPRAASDSLIMDVKRAMKNHYSAWPKVHGAVKPRVFVAWK